MPRRESPLENKESSTHRAESLKLLVGNEASVQAEEEDGGVGQHAPQDDQVVHVGTGHFDHSGETGGLSVSNPRHHSRSERGAEPPRAVLLLEGGV